MEELHPTGLLRAFGLSMDTDMLPVAFYEPLDERRYRATPATMSPWSPALQHGGPPSALALHVLEREYPRPDLRVARAVIDFLGPIPLGDVSVRSEIVRPGKRIELSRTLISSGGRDVVAAGVWRLAARTDVPVPAGVIAREDVARLPAIPAPQPYEWFSEGEGSPYGRAIEWRFTAGGFRSLGPADVWTRPRLPLVEGRDIVPVERVALVADSANGLSTELDWAKFLFVPPSIVITLDRYPGGEWTFLGAETHVGPDGIGFTSCRLGDESGLIGLATQPLLLEPRG